MTRVSAGDVGRHLGRLFDVGSGVGLTDGELLERVAQRRDERAEAAFEILLARHGAMVLTVCRQVLGDAHAAEDTFQATFLVLVRRAGSLRLRAPGTVGPWLYGVAYRIALKARRDDARRRARERRATVPAVGNTSAAIAQGEVQALLHEEINRLPAKYRAPVVLCYLEGRTHDEAAAALQWPVGTIRGRLARARDLLRARLTRRGLAPDGWAGAALLGPAARIAPPARLLGATVRAAIGGMPAGAVTALANFMLRGLLLARLTMTVAVLSIVLILAGFGFALRDTPESQPQRPPDPAAATVATTQDRPTPVDRHGDPLPKYSRARIGTIRFHDGSPVEQVLFTPDAKSLVTVDRDAAVVNVWEASTGRLIREIGSAPAELPGVRPSRGIALSPDGTTLATADFQNQLRLWDMATGHERRRWLQPKDQQYSGAPRLSHGGRTVAVSETSPMFVALWDTTTPIETCRKIPGDWVRLWDLKFSPDGTILATATRDADPVRGTALIGSQRGSTRLWDLASGKERKRFPVEGLDVQSLAFSPDGKLLAAAVTDGTVRFYDLGTGLERMPRLGPEQMDPPPASDVYAAPTRPRVLRCLVFSPDGSILAGGTAPKPKGGWVSGLGDFSLAPIHLWDVARGRELHHIPAHQEWVASLAFSPDGKTLASTGAEPVVRLWDVATGREAFPQSGHRSAVSRLVVSPADGTVFTGGSDGTIQQWDPSSGRELGLIARVGGPIEALAVAPDGKTLLVSVLEYEPRSVAWIGIFSEADRREIRRLAGVPEREVPEHVAYSPDGKTVASERQVWNAGSGEVLVMLRHQDPKKDRFMSFCPIDYTPDGERLITAEPDGVRIWDPATGREVRQAIRWSNYHLHATLSPDGRFLGTQGIAGESPDRSDKTPIVVWELSSGQEAARLKSPGEWIYCRAFSPDGRFLASAAGDRRRPRGALVRVWDLATGRLLRQFEGHRGGVNAVAFARDGRSVISASDDATAQVWDISDLTDHPAGSEPIPAQMLNARWNELAAADARAAYRATWALSVPSAVAFLQEYLHPATSPDPKGVPATTGPIGPPEVLRTLRAIAALERVGTPEARAVLERMAGGDPDAIETRDAKSALDRLNRRRSTSGR